MALAESIFTKLSTAAAVTAIIGSAGDAKVYPGQAPSGTGAPYVAWQVIAHVPDTTLGEASASGKHFIQFSCLGATYLAARDLGSALVAALDNVTLAGGEVCLSCSSDDGFSESTDEFLRVVEAIFFVPAAA